MSLMDLIPSSLVRMFARPYVAGDSIQAAMSVAQQLEQHPGIVSTLDLLAEEVQSQQRIDANKLAYRDLITTVGEDASFAKAERRPTVSVKLSSFTLAPLDQGGDGNGCREAVEEVAELAREKQVAISIDMEDHHWTDLTLDITCDLFRRGFDVGAVLQTRLHRTEADLSRIPEGMRVRMVIGIYLEPASVALTDKPAMKERLLVQSASLMERGVYVEFATHDQNIMRRFFSEIVVPAKYAGSSYEVQMLYGVPRADLLRAIRNGALTAELSVPRTRLYVPFATAWDQATAYCQRRLKANPDMAFYVMKNFLGIIRGRSPGLGQYLS